MNLRGLLVDRVDYNGDPSCNRYLLGEDDWGDLWVPPRRSTIRSNPHALWTRRFKDWNPLHWAYFVGSYARGSIVFLDMGACP